MLPPLNGPTINMSQTFENAKEMLEHVAKEGVGWAHAQGYRWYWKTFRPALEQAAAAKTLESETLADCYYVCGDIHDFNQAPKAAIEEYRRVLEIEPDSSSAFRELASMYSALGLYEEALRHSDQALRLDPDDEFARKDRQEIEGAISENDAPLYSAGPVLDAYELLAIFNPGRALNCLKGLNESEALRARACCYGAMRQDNLYLAEWSSILDQETLIWFSYADWFFMADDIYAAPDLWELLLNAKVEYKGVFTDFAGLDESERYCALSENDKIRLKLQYYVYAQSRNLFGLRELYREYPEWKELAEGVRNRR